MEEIAEHLCRSVHNMASRRMGEFHCRRTCGVIPTLNWRLNTHYILKHERFGELFLQKYREHLMPEVTANPEELLTVDEEKVGNISE